MKLTSIVSIYTLFWVLSCFLVMPFGIRTHADVAGTADAQERVVGQVESAPVNFRPRRIALRAAVLALVLFSLHYLNYTRHWVTAQAIAAALPMPKIGQ